MSKIEDFANKLFYFKYQQLNNNSNISSKNMILIFLSTLKRFNYDY